MFMVIQSSVVKELVCPSLRNPSEPTPLGFDFIQEFYNNSVWKERSTTDIYITSVNVSGFDKKMK